MNLNKVPHLVRQKTQNGKHKQKPGTEEVGSAGSTRLKARMPGLDPPSDPPSEPSLGSDEEPSDSDTVKDREEEPGNEETEKEQYLKKELRNI